MVNRNQPCGDIGVDMVKGDKKLWTSFMDDL